MQSTCKIVVMKLANAPLLLTLTLTLTLCVGMARATPVSPGGTVFNDTFLASQDVTLLADNVNVAWTVGTGSATAFGTYTDAVYRNTAGTLDFVYQFSVNSMSHVGISETTATDFGSFTTDVGFVSNGGSLPGGIFVNGFPGKVADNIGRSCDNATCTVGSTVTFNFSMAHIHNILPGQTSAVLMVSTNATKDIAEANGGGLIASSGAPIMGFGPTSPVPEPSFLVPLGGVTLVLGVFMARRRKRQVLS